MEVYFSTHVGFFGLFGHPFIADVIQRSRDLATALRDVTPFEVAKFQPFFLNFYPVYNGLHSQSVFSNRTMLTRSFFTTSSSLFIAYVGWWRRFESLNPRSLYHDYAVYPKKKPAVVHST